MAVVRLHANMVGEPTDSSYSPSLCPSGKPQVTNGPYAKPQKMVSGFFIIEAADKEEAVRVASLSHVPTDFVGENRSGVVLRGVAFIH